MKKNKIFKTDIFKYILLFAVISTSYLSAQLLKIKDTEAVVAIMRFLIIALILVCGIQLSNPKNRKKKLFETLILYIILIAFVMRIGYMLRTPSILRQHDVSDFTIAGAGHDGYILSLLSGRLPSENTYQFYHPPLFHALSAMVVRLFMPFFKTAEPKTFIEGAQVISCFSSCMSLLIFKKICEHIGFDKKEALVPLSAIAFFPSFYLLSGYINNDSLSIFFIMLSILYTLKWFNNTSFKNTVVLALSIGMGMMTKLSVGIIAIFTAGVFAVRLFAAVREKSAQRLVIRLAVFAAICFPLGLWYPIRNYLLFGQSLTFVNKVTNEALFCGNVSFFERFLSFDFAHLVSPVFANVYADNNLPLYILKNALFGEYKIGSSLIVCSMLIVVYLIFKLVTLGGSAAALFHFKKNPLLCSVSAVGILFFVAFISFNIKYPFRCTMDYRYIIPCTPVGVLLSAYSCQAIKNTAVKKTYTNIFYVTTWVFSILSVLAYL